jgi:hypothetical protein
MLPRPQIFALCALTLASPAVATVYLCKEPSGRSVYQNEPCPVDTLLRTIDEDPRVNVLPSAPPPRSVAIEPRPVVKAIKEKPSKKTKARTGNPDERRFLREGLEEAEVLHKVGPPDLRNTGPAPSGRGKVKRWVYLPVSGDPDTITTVMFQQGKVVAVERKVSR